MYGWRLASIEATDGWVGGAYEPKADPDKHIFRPTWVSLRSYVLPLAFLSIFLFVDETCTVCQLSVAFELPTFRNVAKYLKSKSDLVSADHVPICPAQIWHSSAHALLTFAEGYGLYQIGQVKFAKSSITQPPIIRLCWNLTLWCTMGARRR